MVLTPSLAAAVITKFWVPNGEPSLGTGPAESVPLPVLPPAALVTPKPQPRLAESKPAESRIVRSDGKARRRGSTRRSRAAIEIPEPVVQRLDRFSGATAFPELAAVVEIVRMVDPPPVTEAGAKLHVARLDAGGVQPRLTGPENPPLSPTKTVTC